MATHDKHANRKDRQLRVPVLPEEGLEIKRLAADAGLPVAAYLRALGLGYRVPGILDNRRVEELARINGDLGRLGGLIKLWLADDRRAAVVGAAALRAALARIEGTQDEMHRIMRTVVLPRARR